MSDERLKLLFGFSLVVLVIILAAIIAIGKVQQETSYGLRDLISLLGPVIGFWSQWAFSSKKEKEEAK